MASLYASTSAAKRRQPAPRWSFSMISVRALVCPQAKPSRSSFSRRSRASTSSPARWACCVASSLWSEKRIQTFHTEKEKEKTYEYARTTPTNRMVPIAENNLGSAWVYCHRRVLSVHGAYGSRPGRVTFPALTLVPIDDALHDAWRAQRPQR